MIDPAQAMEDVYAAALTAQEAAIAALVDGADLAALRRGAGGSSPPTPAGRVRRSRRSRRWARPSASNSVSALSPKMRGTAQKVRAGQANVQIALPG